MCFEKHLAFSSKNVNLLSNEGAKFKKGTKRVRESTCAHPHAPNSTYRKTHCAVLFPTGNIDLDRISRLSGYVADDNKNVILNNFALSFSYTHRSMCRDKINLFPCPSQSALNPENHLSCEQSVSLLMFLKCQEITHPRQLLGK